MKHARKQFLTPIEWAIWLSSVTVTLASFFLSPTRDALNLAASLFGVTALIFVAKGRALGHFLCLIFALLYGVASWRLAYYGEMITYLGMSAPMALFSLIAWVRHPAKDAREVEVARLTRRSLTGLLLLTVAVTAAFYFILRALNTAELAVSTVSIATSFLAAGLTFLRSPYYALAYTANDVVLIVLWILAALRDPSSAVMVACFALFLVNDLYGFFNWCRMRQRQATKAS
ncbi:MAG: nicotinamide mononucleotide transporter [Clostridia bacterium]|nr:nicotinamide mononucleotide transporter [Clostridia bacterium]